MDTSTRLEPKAGRYRARLLARRLAELPRADLGIFPTPLHRLPTLGRRVGTDQLYIKRDDLAGLALGGNKVRSLEYLIGAALGRGADTLVCGGGVQSNMCRLAAAAAARLGLRCILVHNDHEPAVTHGNHLLNRLLGASSVFAGPMDETERDDLCHEVAAAQEARGHRPAIIEHGGSTPRGSVGYAGAALELWHQDWALQLGLQHIVIVGAMGGTAAGLIAGLGLLGAPYYVHVISVEYPHAELAARLGSLSDGTVGILTRAVVAESQQGDTSPVPSDQFVSIYEQYLGSGYALPTAAGRAALSLAARLEAILLEPIYTAKTMAGCLDLIRQGVIPQDEGCCFWHTGGTGALFAMPEEALAQGVQDLDISSEPIV